MSEVRRERELTRVEEILIAIVVGTVFLFVVLPLLYRQPPGVRRSQCLSNLKQTDLALIMYAGDYDDRFPPNKWMDQIQPYSKNEFLLHDVLGDESKPDEYGYAFRASALGVNSTKLRKPDQFVIVFDSTNTTRNATGELSLLPNPGRHNGVDMVGFADGHVKAWPTDNRLAANLKADAVAGLPPP